MDMFLKLPDFAVDFAGDFTGNNKSKVADSEVARKKALAKAAAAAKAESSKSESLRTPRPDASIRSTRSAKERSHKISEALDFMTAYSSYDSDVEPTAPSSLDWRMPPEQSCSDWTLEVSSGNGASKKYYVHKSMLILESEYFQNQFSKAKACDVPSVSRFVFQEKATSVFPDLLDYIYSQGKIEMTTGNVVAFHFFGRYFGMKRLRWEAKQFWQEDLTFETVAKYYQDAIIFRDTKLMTGVKDACSKPEVLLRIHTTSPILKVSDPQLLLHVVESVGPFHSEHLSLLVAHFCYRRNIPADTFLRLVSTEKVPIVSFDAAMMLLEEERIFLVKKREETELSSLQARCIKALEQRWEDIDHKTLKFSAFLSMQSSLFLGELLKRTLAASQATIKGESPDYEEESPIEEREPTHSSSPEITVIVSSEHLDTISDEATVSRQNLTPAEKLVPPSQEECKTRTPKNNRLSEKMHEMACAMKAEAEALIQDVKPDEVSEFRSSISPTLPELGDLMSETVSTNHEKMPSPKNCSTPRTAAVEALMQVGMTTSPSDEAPDFALAKPLSPGRRKPSLLESVVRE